jgi:putative toxin-antitoxin system antitoxin component (TIGR02293 family)
MPFDVLFRAFGMKRSDAGPGKTTSHAVPLRRKAKKKAVSGKSVGVIRVVKHKAGTSTKKTTQQFYKVVPPHGDKIFGAGTMVVKGYFDRITGLSTVTDAPAYGISPSRSKTGETAQPTFDVVVVGKRIFQVEPAALKHLRGFTEDEIHSLVVPRRTLARRVADREPLTVEETDKAVRLARVDRLASDVFGDAAKAHRWLRKPKGSLEGETPLAYLATEAGARVVEEMLNQIDHGILP